MRAWTDIVPFTPGRSPGRERQGIFATFHSNGQLYFSKSFRDKAEYSNFVELSFSPGNSTLLFNFKREATRRTLKLHQGAVQISHFLKSIDLEITPGRYTIDRINIADVGVYWGVNVIKPKAKEPLKRFISIDDRYQREDFDSVAEKAVGFFAVDSGLNFSKYSLKITSAPVYEKNQSLYAILSSGSIEFLGHHP